MRQFACLMRAVYYTNGSIYFLIVCPFDPGKKTPKEIRRAGLNAKYSVLAKHCIMSRDWCTNGVVWPVILAMYVQECKHIYVSISLAATSQKSKGQVHIMFFAICRSNDLISTLLLDSCLYNLNSHECLLEVTRSWQFCKKHGLDVLESGNLQSYT